MGLGPGRIGVRSNLPSLLNHQKALLCSQTTSLFSLLFTMPKASTRSPLPTSSSDFALPSSSSSSPGASGSSVTLDDPAVLFHRLRRSSFLQKAGFLSETRLHSPLASAYTFHVRRRSQNAFIAEESESDKERMMTDSPNSSETHTPPLKVPGNSEEDLSTVSKPVVRLPPLTPPRRRSSASMDASDMPTIFNRRLSFPVGFFCCLPIWRGHC